MNYVVAAMVVLLGVVLIMAGMTGQGTAAYEAIFGAGKGTQNTPAAFTFGLPGGSSGSNTPAAPSTGSVSA